MSRWTAFWVAAAVVAVALTLASGRAGNGGRRAHGSPPDAAAAGGAGARWQSGGPRHLEAGELPDYADEGREAEPRGAQPFPEVAGLAPEDARSGPGEQGAPQDAARGGRLRSREPPVFEILRNSASAEIPRSVRELAEEITAGATNDVGRARAIYDWLTRNITYDTAEWENIAAGAGDYIHDHDPESVLERGNTVCIGYAWLFDNLCEAAGIEATWLIGDVRGYRGTADDELVSDIRHAWNAVRLDDGEWHLLDATWGALQEGERESAATRDRADYYFDTPPSQFVYDHLPENEEWQLLETAMPTESAFSVLPNLKPSFFSNGLELGDGYTSVLRAQAGNAAALAFSAPSGVESIATIGLAGAPESFRRIRIAKVPGGDGFAAIVPPLPAGEHLLRLYSGKPSAKTLECSADFLIRAE